MGLKNILSRSNGLINLGSPITMYRKFAILVYLSMVVGSSFAQNEVDSLSALLSEQVEDSFKVKTYLEFFYTDLFYDDPELVIAYTKQALALSEKIGYPIGEAESCTTLGYMYRIRSENDSAFRYFGLGLKKAEEISYVKGQFDALSGLGNTNNGMGKWEEAIQYFKQAEDLGRNYSDSSMIASANNNIGNIYLSNGLLTDALKSYQKAAELGSLSIREVAFINIGLVHAELENLEIATDYLNQGLEMSQSSENLYNQAFIYKHLGSVKQLQGQKSAAINYYQEASKIYTSINERYHASDILTNMAGLFFEDGSYPEALENYQRSLSIQSDIDHFVGQCNNYLGIGKTLLALTEYDRAQRNLLEADRLADEHSLLTAKDNIIENLGLLYAEIGDFQKALEYQVLFKVLSDSILNQEKSKQIAELETQYETTQKEQEIELLSAENEIASLQLQKQQDLRNYLIIAAAFLLILIGVLYNRYQIKAKANHKLKELDEIKTSFFTNISHEFRTPLTLILSPIQNLLSRQSDNPTNSQQELEIVQRNATHLLELTNQLMDLSKLEAGKLTLSVSPGDFSAFVKTIVASFESLASTQNIKFQCELVNIPQEIYFDGDKIQKILNNLLSNAFKFTPDGGEISVEGTLTGSSIQVAIKDSGPGIPQRELNKIFNRFHQTNTNKQSPGTGVGLTLTKELAALHHGKIKVDSQVGQGSTFTFTFPKNKSAYATFELSQEDSHVRLVDSIPEIYENTELEEILDTDKSVVLIVEDNADLRKHIKHLLQNDYKVKEAANGKEGLELAMSCIPDIVISDLMMPEMDGITLCNELKLNEKTNHIPIILLTAKADRDSKLDGLKQGADDYLTKPFDNDELFIRIENLIKQRADLRSRYSQILLLEPSNIEVTSPDEEFIKKALDIVDQFLSDTTFTVEQFQQEIGMSRMQLHRKLKALTQFSASEFIRDIRLKRAANLLAQNGKNISEVAYSSGFNSVSYFTQCFKEKYGKTPSDYMKKRIS